MARHPYFESLYGAYKTDEPKRVAEHIEAKKERTIEKLPEDPPPWFFLEKEKGVLSFYQGMLTDIPLTLSQVPNRPFRPERLIIECPYPLLVQIDQVYIKNLGIFDYPVSAAFFPMLPFDLRKHLTLDSDIKKWEDLTRLDFPTCGVSSRIQIHIKKSTICGDFPIAVAMQGHYQAQP